MSWTQNKIDRYIRRVRDYQANNAVPIKGDRATGQGGMAERVAVAADCGTFASWLAARRFRAINPAAEQRHLYVYDKELEASWPNGFRNFVEEFAMATFEAEDSTVVSFARLGHKMRNAIISALLEIYEEATPVELKDQCLPFNRGITD